MSGASELPLRVAGLRKRYRKHVVLAGLELQVEPGEAVAIIGRNGAGKSTLLGCVTGERLPTSGEVRVCGVDPFSDPVGAAKCMGFVPEQPFLYGELTVGEMLSFVAAARGMAPEAASAETERLLALLGLSGAEKLLCRELSQGMGRKVAILSGLLHEPRLLVLDEVLNGLDQSSAARLIEELDDRRGRGTAVLISSHDLSFLAAWCDRGLVLAPGAEWADLRGERWDGWVDHPTLEP